jgi:hypothetical protein
MDIFRCEECGYRFFQQEHLEVHRRDKCLWRAPATPAAPAAKKEEPPAKTKTKE